VARSAFVRYHLVMEQQRSAIPKVVGILMIIFASLGLLHTLATVVQAQLAKELIGSNSYTRVMLVFGLLDFAIGILHLVAGLRALGYKDSAPRLAMLYGTLKIITSLGMMIIMYAWIRGPGDMGAGEGAIVGMVFVVTAIFYMAWPIVVLALMSRPSARAACVNF
jgi:hypothetical protein